MRTHGALRKPKEAPQLRIPKTLPREKELNKEHTRELNNLPKGPGKNKKPSPEIDHIEKTCRKNEARRRKGPAN